MKGAVAWFAENHVAANLLMLFILMTGVWAGLTTKLEIFPETTLDTITISTSYPGASPSEVEEAVVRKIEEQVAGLAGIIGILELQESGDVATTFARLACRDQVGPFQATGQGSHHGHEDTRQLRVTRRIGRSDCKRVQAVFEQSRVPAPCVLMA